MHPWVVRVAEGVGAWVGVGVWVKLCWSSVCCVCMVAVEEGEVELCLLAVFVVILCMYRSINALLSLWIFAARAVSALIMLSHKALSRWA